MLYLPLRNGCYSSVVGTLNVSLDMQRIPGPKFMALLTAEFCACDP